jgi:hypothetical protein
MYSGYWMKVGAVFIGGSCGAVEWFIGKMAFDSPSTQSDHV